MSEPKHDATSEKGSAHLSDAEAAPVRANGGLARQMSSRQISMISIGAVIGTGLFVGTASALHNGGPLGLFLAYAIMGTVCYSVMISLGEMVAFLPIEGGHIRLAERFVEPAWGATIGYFYCYFLTIAMPAELSAAAVIFDYWTETRINNAVYITVCLILVVLINLLAVRWYGEAEFFFASIKVITIVGLVILGIVIDLGGGPRHDRIGFRYWKDPGPFAQYLEIPGSLGRFLGFVSCLNQATFSFIGTEIVAIAAGETKDPRRSLPRAIKAVWVRIVLFYVVGTFVIGLLVPSNEPGLSLGAHDAKGSPFVIASAISKRLLERAVLMRRLRIEKAGIKVLPSIINACLLTSAWSAASSDLYTSSRALYGLSRSGRMPAIFSRTSSHGLPFVAVGFCAAFGLLGYLAVSETAGKVFGWLASLVAMSGLMCWVGITVSYIRFYRGLKRQGIDRRTLPYASRMQPYAAWYACIACIILGFFSGVSVFLKGQWNTSVFVTNYLPALAFPIVYILTKVALRSKLVPLDVMDLSTGAEDIDNTYSKVNEPRNAGLEA